MLRERLVCGVRNEHVQKRLLVEKDLTFAKAKELAKSMEAAAEGSKHIFKKNLKFLSKELTTPTKARREVGGEVLQLMMYSSHAHPSHAHLKDEGN